MKKQLLLWLVPLAIALLWLSHRSSPSASAQETRSATGLRLFVANKGAVRVACRDANSNVDSMSIIDPAQPSPLAATVPVGGSPQGIAVRPTAALAYVANA